ncbi:N-acetylglucosamine kinase [Nonomuraea fastidiosa]|jgi:N-acetylglucosamine kinase-like BadF-type ATPase|uniref:N-acetylglucosamine kinase n=1 Tax=Nonomuraea TaxID=83681 RepID=UPI00324CAB16
MDLYLGIDAGGTSTRALLTTSTGERVGYGLAGGGNPVAHGVDAALAQITAAVKQALGEIDPGRVANGVIGLAGLGALQDSAVHAAFTRAWAGCGLRFPVRGLEDPLLAFVAGTPQPSGHVLLSGTGAVALRVEDRRVTHVADGHGWLLGDEGSGFWLGRAAARHTIRHLTATPAVRPEPGISGGSSTHPPTTGTAGEQRTETGRSPASAAADPTGEHTVDGRSRGSAAGNATGERTVDGRSDRPADAGHAGELVRLVAEAVAGPGAEPTARIADLLIIRAQAAPVATLAPLAPLVGKAAQAGDPAAVAIVESAAERLLATLAQVRAPGETSPIVLAGGVLTAEGPVREHVRRLCEKRWTTPVTIAGDTAAAAAWLAAGAQGPHAAWLRATP